MMKLVWIETSLLPGEMRNQVRFLIEDWVTGLRNLTTKGPYGLLGDPHIRFSINQWGHEGIVIPLLYKLYENAFHDKGMVNFYPFYTLKGKTPQEWKPGGTENNSEQPNNELYSKCPTTNY